MHRFYANITLDKTPWIAYPGAMTMTGHTALRRRR
jgi:hypothetical protein